MLKFRLYLPIFSCFSSWFNALLLFNLYFVHSFEINSNYYDDFAIFCQDLRLLQNWMSVCTVFILYFDSKRMFYGVFSYLNQKDKSCLKKVS